MDAPLWKSHVAVVVCIDLEWVGPAGWRRRRQRVRKTTTEQDWLEEWVPVALSRAQLISRVSNSITTKKMAKTMLFGNIHHTFSSMHSGQADMPVDGQFYVVLEGSSACAVERGMAGQSFATFTIPLSFACAPKQSEAILIIISTLL